MSVTTTLLGPYDDVASADKTIVSASIPPEVKERLFVDCLTRRGAVDKVICRQLFIIDAYLCKFPHLKALSSDEKEAVVNRLLNSIVEHVASLDDKQETKQNQ